MRPYTTTQVMASKISIDSIIEIDGNLYIVRQRGYVGADEIGFSLEDVYTRNLSYKIVKYNSAIHLIRGR